MLTISPLLLSFLHEHERLLDAVPRSSLAGFLSVRAWGFEELISGRTDGTHASFQFSIHSEDEDYLRLSYRFIVRDSGGVTSEQPLSVGNEDYMRADMAYYLRQHYFSTDMADTPMAYKFRFFVQHLVNELRASELPVSAFGY